MLVVGFIALAGIGVYVVYDKVQTTNIANEEIQTLNLIHASIKSLYKVNPNPTYFGLNNEIASNTNIIPAKMKGSSPSDIRNRFGGLVSIYGSVIDRTYAFEVAHRLVPSAICTKLVTGGARNFDQVVVNDVLVKNPLATDKSLDIALTTTQCNKLSANYIVMTSY